MERTTEGRIGISIWKRMLDSNQKKDALILAKESGVELKTLPTKLVAVKKKKTK